MEGFKHLVMTCLHELGFGTGVDRGVRVQHALLMTHYP
jgi:hypothetical protein